MKKHIIFCLFFKIFIASLCGTVIAGNKINNFKEYINNEYYDIDSVLVLGVGDSGDEKLQIEQKYNFDLIIPVSRKGNKIEDYIRATVAKLGIKTSKLQDLNGKRIRELNAYSWGTSEIIDLFSSDPNIRVKELHLYGSPHSATLSGLQDAIDRGQIGKIHFHINDGDKITWLSQLPNLTNKGGLPFGSAESQIVFHYYRTTKNSKDLIIKNPSIGYTKYNHYNCKERNHDLEAYLKNRIHKYSRLMPVWWQPATKIYTMHEDAPGLVNMGKSIANMAGLAKPDKVMLVGNDDKALRAMRSGLPANTSYIAIPYLHKDQVNNAIKLHKPDSVLILKPGPESTKDISVAQIPKYKSLEKQDPIKNTPTSTRIYTMHEGAPGLVNVAKSMANMAGLTKPDKVMLVGNEDKALRAMRSGLPANTSYIAIPYLHKDQVNNAIKLHKPDSVLILKPGPESTKDISVAQIPKYKSLEKPDLIKNTPKPSYNAQINFQNIGASSFGTGRLANVWQGDVKLGMPLIQTVQEISDFAERSGVRDLSVVYNSSGGSFAAALKPLLEDKGLKVGLVPNNSLSKTTMVSIGMGSHMPNYMVISVDGGNLSPSIYPKDPKSFPLQNQTGDFTGTQRIVPVLLPTPMNTIPIAPILNSTSPLQTAPKPSLPAQTFGPMITPSQEIKPPPQLQIYNKPSQDYKPSPKGLSPGPIYIPPSNPVQTPLPTPIQTPPPTQVYTPPPTPIYTPPPTQFYTPPPPVFIPPPVFNPPPINFPR